MRNSVKIKELATLVAWDRSLRSSASCQQGYAGFSKENIAYVSKKVTSSQGKCSERSFQAVERSRSAGNGGTLKLGMG